MLTKTFTHSFAVMLYGIKMETRLKWKCMGHQVKKTMNSDTDTYG